MLTTQQLQTLKAWVIANANGVFDQTTADTLNTYATPAFRVWRTSVTEPEITQNTFDWTRVDNLSVGKARIWDWMFRGGQINPSNPAIRSGINEAWKGTAADLDVRAVVYSHCWEQATVAEKLFATGAGSVPDQNGIGPATRSFIGLISVADLIAADAS